MASINLYKVDVNKVQTCKFPSKNQQKSHGLNFDNRFITLYNNLSHLSTSTF